MIEAILVKSEYGLPMSISDTMQLSFLLDRDSTSTATSTALLLPLRLVLQEAMLELKAI